MSETEKTKAEQNSSLEPGPAGPNVTLIEDYLSVLIMGILACITFANVLVRYFTNQSFAWTEEISIFFLIIVTMVGASSAFVRHQHIRIEYFAEKGSAVKTWWFSFLSNLSVLLFFVLFWVLSLKMVFDDYEFGDTSPAIGVPNWWYSMWMPVFSLLITLRIAGVLWRLLKVKPQ
ncbi:MAG: TRAP transporter small permease [Alcaligenaceae bacterium]|nr:TRAP transporter small permease [Alcaligenaceae bacterium]